jgi:hypothetical protein
MLTGKHIRLEPLKRRHQSGLVAAVLAGDPSLYPWSPVPQGEVEIARYVDTGLAWREAGTAVPFATVRLEDGAVIGSTRFWNIERWAWPSGHDRYGRSNPDACEIGYTWLTHSAIRTPGEYRSEIAHADPRIRDMASVASLFSHGRAGQLSRSRRNCSSTASRSGECRERLSSSSASATMW